MSASKDRQPDWSKFGLDEKQPLNPGSTGHTKAEEPPDLFGGQVQHDNELFAEDQVRKCVAFEIK